METMTDTPETNAAKRPSGLRACADGLDVNPDKDFAQKCMRHAADRMEQLERERDELAKRLDFQKKLNRECFDLITARTNERDEWRNDHDRVVREYQSYRLMVIASVIDATSYPENEIAQTRNNLNPHWIVVDSRTNQNP